MNTLVQVSKGFGAWAMHWAVLKALMYVLGASAAIPFLELASYAGYPFVPACIAMLARLTLGAHTLQDGLRISYFKVHTTQDHDLIERCSTVLGNMLLCSCWSNLQMFMLGR